MPHLRKSAKVCFLRNCDGLFVVACIILHAASAWFDFPACVRLNSFLYLEVAHFSKSFVNGQRKCQHILCNLFFSMRDVVSTEHSFANHSVCCSHLWKSGVHQHEFQYGQTRVGTICSEVAISFQGSYLYCYICSSCSVKACCIPAALCWT